MSPRLLDLFCGAGGASMGYHRVEKIRRARNAEVDALYEEYKPRLAQLWDRIRELRERAE